MKKLIAIVLLSIYSLSFFARHPAYLTCMQVNAFSGSPCDCEKILNDKKDNTAATTKSHIHLSIEENYTFPLTYLLLLFGMTLQKKTNKCFFNWPEKIPIAHWQPPRLAVLLYKPPTT